MATTICNISLFIQVNVIWTTSLFVMGLYELIGNPTTYYPGPSVLCVSIHILNVCFSSYELIRLSSMQQFELLPYLWLHDLVVFLRLYLVIQYIYESEHIIIRYAQDQKIGKPNNLKLFGSKVA
jgi:hypothetical protein